MEKNRWNGVRRMKLHCKNWHGFESCVGLLIVTLHQNKCQLNWRLCHRYTLYNSIRISRYQHASRSATHGFTVIYHNNYYIDLSSSILWNLKIGCSFRLADIISFDPVFLFRPFSSFLPLSITFEKLSVYNLSINKHIYTFYCCFLNVNLYVIQRCYTYN